MKNKRLMKKLVLNKATVSNLCFDSMNEVVAGLTPISRLESYCPDFTCGEQFCAATRLSPAAFC